MIQDEFKEEIGLKKHWKRELLEANSKTGRTCTGGNDGMGKSEMMKTRWEDGFKLVLKGKGQLTGSDPQ